MRLKFGQIPAEYMAQIAAAPGDTVEAFLERVLNAASLEAVFTPN